MAHRALVSSEQRMQRLPPQYLERLIESSSDIVVAVDRAGTVIYYNDGAEKILGYTAAEIMGESVLKLYPSAEEAHRVIAAMRSELYGGPGKVKNFETIFVNRWGEKIPVAISGSILWDDNGLEIGSIGFAKDIREIRHRDRLATLGEVAVALCHEINSPLEVIMNDVALLEKFVGEVCQDEQAVVQEERIEAVRREVQKIQSIVNRLVDMAQKGEYGTREYLAGQEMTDVSVAPAPAPKPAGEGLAGLRVLVVDDDLGVCRSLRDLLAAEGCEVTTATDGLMALEVLNRATIDVILSDVVMPDLDGYDLFMEVRRRGVGPPVILMTGYYYDRDHVIKRSRLQGLESVIFKKPIDPKRLKTAILKATGRETAEAPAT